MTADGSNFENIGFRVQSYENEALDGEHGIQLIATDFPHVHPTNLRASFNSGSSSTKAAGAVLVLHPGGHTQAQRLHLGHPAPGVYLTAKPHYQPDFQLQGQKIEKPADIPVKSGLKNRTG